MPRRINVAILGAGIGAAFAIRACEDFSDSVICALYAQTRVSPPHASFWIHCERGIPFSWGVEPELILVDSLGMKREYYGQLLWNWKDAPTSFPSTKHWTMGADAQRFWAGQINHVALVESTFCTEADIADLAVNYDLVFKTFRLEANLQQVRPVFVTKKLKLPVKCGWVVYNGSGRGSWLRQSQLFGSRWEYTEWAEQPEDESTTIYKIRPGSVPAPEDLPDNVVSLGRYGKWERKHLAHENYWVVLDALKTFSNSGKAK